MGVSLIEQFTVDHRQFVYEQKKSERERSVSSNVEHTACLMKANDKDVNYGHVDVSKTQYVKLEGKKLRQFVESKQVNEWGKKLVCERKTNIELAKQK